MGLCFSKDNINEEPHNKTENKTEDKTDKNIKLYPIEIKNVVHITNNIQDGFKENDKIINKEIIINTEFLTNKIENNLKINKKENINVLYVEDNQVYFSLMKYIFKKHIRKKVNFHWKKTVKEAYNFIKTIDIDLIFLDRQLNDEMGDDLLQLLLMDKYNISKVIFISALDDIDDINKYEKMGIYYYVKPIKIDQFIKTMNKIFK